MLLIRLLTGKGLEPLAREMVLDVSDDYASSGSAWSISVDKSIADRNTAFAKANQIREALKDEVSWSRSVTDLEAFLELL
jgi:hypothetical protein